MLYPAHYGNNPLFPKTTDFEIVGKDEHSGKGVICYRPFKRGEVIAYISGEIVDEIRQHTLQISPQQHLFDPYFSGYFLHSCSPNISLDMKKMIVTAIKDIPTWHFLYMDYAETEDHLYKQFLCSCGEANCRGWITGKKDLPDPQAMPRLQTMISQSRN